MITEKLLMPYVFLSQHGIVHAALLMVMTIAPLLGDAYLNTKPFD